jgi:hypothetical protein
MIQISAAVRLMPVAISGEKQHKIARGEAVRKQFDE